MVGGDGDNADLGLPDDPNTVDLMQPETTAVLIVAARNNRDLSI